MVKGGQLLTSKPGSTDVQRIHESNPAAASSQAVGRGEGSHLAWSRLSCLVCNKCSSIHYFCSL